MRAVPTGSRMVALGFVAQNLAVGLTFGTYSTFVPSFTATFDASRTMTSFGLALVTLMLGLSSPWVGRLVGRHACRNVMTSGALVMAGGFALIAAAPSMPLVLTGYAVVGIGANLLGPIPAMALVGGWFEGERGRAIGIVLMPVGVSVMPLVSAALIDTVGWRVAVAGFAGLVLAAIPLLRLIRNAPESVGGSGAQSQQSARFTAPPEFWVIALASGLIVGGGTALATHIVPFVQILGIDLQRASLLLAALGGCAMLGSPLFGWLADRIGGSAALAVNALVQAAAWLALLSVSSFWPLLVTGVVIGACAGGVTSAIGAMLSTEYGQAFFGQAFGRLMVVKLPFTFGMPPLMGWLFDMSGNYRDAFMLQVILFVIAVAAFARHARLSAATTALSETSEGR